MTVSIGFATFPGDAVDSPSLIRRADKALYLAKDLGKNRVAWIDAEGSGSPAPTQKP